MNLPTEVFGEVIVVHAPDELCEDAADRFTQFLEGLPRTRVAVDLDGVESVDSTGLAALLDAQERLRSAQGDLKIVSKNHVNRKILEITRLDQQLEVFDSVIEAVRSFI
jgi:anti-anti-sigma factor